MHRRDIGVYREDTAIRRKPSAVRDIGNGYLALLSLDGQYVDDPAEAPLTDASDEGACHGAHRIGFDLRHAFPAGPLGSVFMNLRPSTTSQNFVFGNSHGADCVIHGEPALTEADDEEGWQRDLERWLELYLETPGNKTRRLMWRAYIAGLIGPGDRKSIQPMAARPEAIADIISRSLISAADLEQRSQQSP
ncbi:hypothetical protein ACFSHP_09475 [Novosphingobium panipatense]|uniref:hypothetical protein n=1 Tax=Novosphingobium panipatense TaxID=428991 RepID=UPI003608FA51